MLIDQDVLAAATAAAVAKGKRQNRRTRRASCVVPLVQAGGGARIDRCARAGARSAERTLQ